jgi:transketolase
MASLQFGPRRAQSFDVTELPKEEAQPLAQADHDLLEGYDAIFRSLCSILYNYVLSGHPGGSVSSGHIVTSLVFDTMDYDLRDPDRRDADMLSYAGGHKALGLYAMWALRDDIARIAAPELLPTDEKQRLRMEDLLGFRRNPTNQGPLFKKFRTKALDGHPTSATPFIRIATGPSGVGVGSSIGMAFAASDLYGPNAPHVNILDGEAGLTPGRVSEAMAAAGTGGLKNAILHCDWNNASIDSDRVCRDGDTPGDYVSWDPRELAYLYDWNVIFVPDGFDFQQVVAAQRKALALGSSKDNTQPTCIVYRTVKGWRYGITGKASHGGGHKLCSPGFFQTLTALTDRGATFPLCGPGAEACGGVNDAVHLEECFWRAISQVREVLERDRAFTDALAARLRRAKARLEERGRKPRPEAPRVDTVYETAAREAKETPSSLKLAPGSTTTLRAELGKALNYLNRASGGAMLTGAADLLGSTSASVVSEGFPAGFFHTAKNPLSRTLSMGGICEDAIGCMTSGISGFGTHIGVGASYAAFIVPLGHIAARVHAITGRARHLIAPDPYKTMILICAHAGLKTGEDGPTHADPQALQLHVENFPKGTAFTLTPWEPCEIWPLLATALALRPAVILPYVTRPNEKIVDREALGLAPASDAAQGVYQLRKSKKAKADGAIVLQDSSVGYAFVQGALPILLKEGVDVDVWYVASAELFSMLPQAEQDRIYPPEVAATAMGITGWTPMTMNHWVTSPRGRAHTLSPFSGGHLLGSGAADAVIKEAGLDGESQAKAILAYVRGR